MVSTEQQTDRELNLLVAERLGWRAWRLPEGHEVLFDRDTYLSPSWFERNGYVRVEYTDILETDVFTAALVDLSLPDFCGNREAAMTLLDAWEGSVTLTRSIDAKWGWYCLLRLPDSSFAGEGRGRLSGAIVLAYLAATAPENTEA